MSLSRVSLTPDVFSVCATHALSTESEEVMGLLLGDIIYDERGELVAQVYVALPQIRADRRKDRVEASPEQLASAMASAEKLSEESGMQVRVIGWYHSHPHITVLPSHVDVATQASYQQLDAGFIGVIFSTFNQDAEQCTQQVQVTAFQSSQQEGGLLTPRASGAPDSPMARALAASAADANQRAREGGQWVRREVPLMVQAQPKASQMFPNGLRNLLSVLFEEERQAYSSAMQRAADSSGAVDFLTAVHHSALCQQQMCKILETTAGPVLDALGAKCWEAEVQVQQLRDAIRAREHAEAERQAAGRAQPQPIPVSYIDAPVEQPAYLSSPTWQIPPRAADPGSPHMTSTTSSTSKPQRVHIKLQGPQPAEHGNAWEDPYNAGIVHIARDSSASRHDQTSVSQQEGQIPKVARTSASSARSSPSKARPPYNPLQNQQQQQQQQQQVLHTSTPTNSPSASPVKPEQQQQQHKSLPYSQAFFRDTSPAMNPPTDHLHGSSSLSSSSSSAQMQDGRVLGRPGSASSYDESASMMPAGEQHRQRQRKPTDSFSELLRPDISKLSIHDLDVWSKLHREGEM